MLKIKSKKEIELMRQAGRIVGQVLEKLAVLIEPGITTGQLDRQSKNLIRKSGGEPAFLGYRGFPASICASVNEEVVHGIPGLRRLREGDIVSIDVGIKYKGYYSDAAATFAVGEISGEACKLINVTRESLQSGISMICSGAHLTDISYAVQSYVEDNGFFVVRDYVGHGIGSMMHEEPQVPNFGAPGHGPRLQDGVVLAIEPMVNIGTWKVKTLSDQWTVVTGDGSLSAHFEHTVAVVNGKPEVMTTL